MLMDDAIEKATQVDKQHVAVASVTLGIIGTGDFGRSLALQAKRKGISVVLGSRNPAEKRPLAEELQIPITTNETVLKSNPKFIVPAVPIETMAYLPWEKLR